MGGVSPGAGRQKKMILGDFAVLADQSGQAWVSSSGYQDVS
jgi:hypothetical protein